jgi:hypothetical protein
MTFEKIKTLIFFKFSNNHPTLKKNTQLLIFLKFGKQPTQLVLNFQILIIYLDDLVTIQESNQS